MFTLKSSVKIIWMALVCITYLTLFLLDIFAGASSGGNEQQRLNEQQRFFENQNREDE